MRQIIDLTGRKFGRLTVLELLPERKNGQPVWMCRCECGRTVEVRRSSLISGKTRSCGCLRKEHHGGGRPPKAEVTPYPANEDCASYDPERGECGLLTELLCATRGTCSFFTPVSGVTP